MIAPDAGSEIWADRQPNAAPWDGSRRLWSLREMVDNFQFQALAGLLTDIDLLVDVSIANQDVVERNGGYQASIVRNHARLTEALAQAVSETKRIVNNCEKLLSVLGCVHINNNNASLLRWVDGDMRWSDLKARTISLRDAIEGELNSYLYYQYPQEKSKKLRNYRADWRRSLAAFPVIEEEVLGAVDCYALGQNTASVFHSMRVAEHGLRAVALERKLKLPKNRPIEWGTWQDIIKALDNEIARIGKGAKAGPTKDAALEFYSGARADVNGFKDEYRNLVMHVRARYDEHQALRAVSNVCHFMERLSEKINYNHRRIKWGRL